MSAGRKVEPPQKPQDGESLRKHISFRTRNELYHFISQIDLNVSELAHVLGVNENTFKALQQGSRDRLPTAEMLFTLYQINFMSEFVHVPRRNVHILFFILFLYTFSIYLKMFLHALHI